MTKYVWVDSIAEKWGVSKSWVYRLCRDGRVSGAFFSEGRWSIPEDAEKPVDYRIHKKYIKALAGSRRIELPSVMPFKLPGESDRIPDDTEKIISECADYVLDLIEAHPASGKLLFAALSYEHINAFVLCENYSQYCYFTALRDCPDELFKKFSIISFEYSMLTPDMRRSYFNEKKKQFNEGRCSSVCESAALLLFFAGTNVQRVIDIDPVSGNVRSEYKKNGIVNFVSKEDIYILSSLLQRATVYRNFAEALEKMNFSEYSALHLTETQYAEKSLGDIEGRVERLIII